MKKYLVVTDTTSAMSKELANQYGIELIPLSVLIDGHEYKDQIDMTTKELYQKLEDGCVPTTSQPNTGYVQIEMEKWQKEKYDAIVIITCSSDLSGTWSGFNLVKNTLNMDNVHIIDSRSVGAPIMDMAIYAKKMFDNGKTLEEVKAGIEKKMKNTFSFLHPENFTQLKKGGRLSPVAANMASLLKIKALLYLKEDGSVVEKYAMARTETKIIRAVLDKFDELNINAKEHCIYLSHANNELIVQKVKEFLQRKFDNIDCVVLALPAVLTCHGGLGCIAIQPTYKL